MTLSPQPLALSPSGEVILTAEKPVSGGRMLARYDGQIVFVAGAIPGERVRARVERVSRQLAYAETIAVLEPSPDRRDAEVDLACGGSLYAHIAYPRQLSLKSELVADAFARIAKMTLPVRVPVTGSDEVGYRMRSRLHARDGKIGFFREGTHDLCDAGPTRQLLPATLAAVSVLDGVLAAAGMSGVTSYDVSENVLALERAVLVEIGPSQVPPLHIEPIDGLTGVLFANHMSARLTLGYGSPYVIDRLDVSGAPVVLEHHVQSFFQGNRFLLQRLVDRVRAQVPEGAATDLYAGVGLFAVSLAGEGRTGIVAVEGDRSSSRDLEGNAARYGDAITVLAEPVEQALRRRSIQNTPTLILDPPRTGVSREAMSGIIALKAPRIVYVSCDLATLARDSRRLVEAGHTLEHIESFDLFPDTAHVETLAVFVRGTR